MKAVIDPLVEVLQLPGIGTVTETNTGPSLLHLGQPPIGIDQAGIAMGGPAGGQGPGLVS